MKKLIWLAGAACLFSSALAEETQSGAARSAFAVPAGYLVIVAVVALIAAIAVVGGMQAQLKTARRQQDATNYVREDSLDLQVKQDRFLYQTVERRKIEQEKK